MTQIFAFNISRYKIAKRKILENSVSIKVELGLKLKLLTVKVKLSVNFK